MKKFGIILSIIVGSTFFQVNEAFATHAAGMDMFYRWTADSSYEFTIILYRNCSGFTASAPTTMPLRYFAPSIGINNSFANSQNLTRLPTTGSGVPPLNPPNMYNCTQATNLCYEEYVYRGVWTSRGKARDWTFATTLCCRPGPPPFANYPMNIQYTAQWLECGLNNLDFPDATAQNWSPLWHNRRPNHPGYTTDTIINYLFRTVCMNNYYTVDQSVKEYQGDSISYEFIIPQGTNGLNAIYNPGYSLANPMPTNLMTLNQSTGVISLIPGMPTGTGVYVMALRAREWRYDTIVSGGAFARVPRQIGFVNRDMTFFIDDTSTCRRDSVHPKNVIITDGGGQKTVDVFFSADNITNSLVRCNTLSPDGSEFRVIDSSNFVAPYDTTVREIGVYKATWTCNAGLTEKVTLHLAEALRCQDYYVFLRIGTDLDVIESECGFLEPDSSSGVISVTKDVQVEIDTLPDVLAYCLPTENPYPKLRAISSDTSSFPLDYYWAYQCDTCSTFDTIPGQEIPAMWAKESGTYEVRVRDPLNCAGDDAIEVYYDTKPSFFFDVPVYCDRYGEAPTMPEFVLAPVDSNPEITTWEWHQVGVGQVATGDTLKAPQLVQDEWYRLIGKKPRINNRVPPSARCEYEFDFYYGRDSFPPQDPLYVSFFEDYIELCTTFGDTGTLSVWEEGLRERYAPYQVQWYFDSLTFPGQEFSITVTDTGMYHVMVTDTLGCWGRDTSLVGQDVQLPGPDIPCNVSGASGIFTFIWPEGSKVVRNEVSYDGGNTWIEANAGDQHIVPSVEQQKFIVGKGIVESACGETEYSTSFECPDEVFPPNVMTPNGDGLNDMFEIPGLDLYDNSEVEVFDRWGNQVFQSSDYKNDWDGDDLPEGTYYYILKVDDPAGTVHKGILTILR